MSSGYGQMRMKNQPITMGIGVTSAKMSKKSETLPGETVRAIVEKRKAESPKPEITIPVIVVLCIEEKNERSHNGERGARTDNSVRETFHDNIQRATITRLATNPGEHLEQNEDKQCSTSGGFCAVLWRVIHRFSTEVSCQ